MKKKLARRKWRTQKHDFDNDNFDEKVWKDDDGDDDDDD